MSERLQGLIGHGAKGVVFCELGIRARTASACTAILACSTTVWVYARMPYSEILQLTCFLGLFRQTLRVAAQPTKRNALWFGVWAGLAFARLIGWVEFAPTRHWDLNETHMAAGLVLSIIISTIAAWLSVRYDCGVKNRY